jgi:hypothetical protein
MAKRLARDVHVRDGRGVPHVFGPHDDVPDWAVAKISNPAAWADGAGLPSAPSAPAREQQRPTRTEVQTTPEAQAAAGADEPPPQRGPGSGTAAWRAYAQRKNVSVADDADRGDIIAALEAAGVRV